MVEVGKTESPLRIKKKNSLDKSPEDRYYYCKKLTALVTVFRTFLFKSIQLFTQPSSGLSSLSEFNYSRSRLSVFLTYFLLALKVYSTPTWKPLLVTLVLSSESSSEDRPRL